MCKYCDGKCLPLPLDDGSITNVEVSVDEYGFCAIDLPEINFGNQRFAPNQVVLRFEFCPKCGREFNENV